MPGQIKIDDGAGNYTVLTNGGSLGSDKTITIPNTTGTMALTSDVPAGGVTEYDEWILTSNLTVDADPIQSNLARPTGTLQTKLGTGMTLASGLWTFPSTGYWQIKICVLVNVGGSGGRLDVDLVTTNDNFSSEDTVGLLRAYNDQSGTAETKTHSQDLMVKISDTSNDKIKFTADFTTGSYIYGATTEASTVFSFVKMADI
jgi:hypothetical protein